MEVSTYRTVAQNQDGVSLGSTHTVLVIFTLLSRSGLCSCPDFRGDFLGWAGLVGQRQLGSAAITDDRSEETEGSGKLH